MMSEHMRHAEENFEHVIRDVTRTSESVITQSSKKCTYSQRDITLDTLMYALHRAKRWMCVVECLVCST